MQETSNADKKIVKKIYLRGRPAQALVTTLAVAASLSALALVRHASVPPKPSKQDGDAVLYYVDPMHPGYKSDKPGIAPDCGMPLEPVHASDIAAAHSQTMADGDVVQINHDVLERFGIRLETVHRGPIVRIVRTIGRVAPEDSRIFHINVGVEGYVKDVSNVVAGSHVTKDQRLAVVYSSELLPVIGGYLSANERLQGGSIRENAPGTQGVASLQNWKDRLRNLGVSESQIAEVTRDGRVPEDIYINSPVDGFVLAREISMGQRFDRFTEFFRIADLRRVWITADLFGDESTVLQPGTVASISGPDHALLKTTHLELLPQLDPSTQASQLRMEVENTNFGLQPDMFVDVEISIPEGNGISVPQDAVLNKGNRQTVYIAGKDGDLASREVKVGSQFGDRVEVLQGIKEGETVVVAGTFLVDAEARLNRPSPPTQPIEDSSALPMINSMQHDGGADDRAHH